MLVDPFNWKVFRYSFSVLHMTCAKPYHIFSIVVVVVESEKKDNWSWFLILLRDGNHGMVDMERDVVIISGR